MGVGGVLTGGRGGAEDSLFGGAREAKAGAGGASYTCNVTLAPLTVKLKSLKQSSYFRFRFWNLLVNVDRCLPNVDTGHGTRGNPTGREEEGRKA